jgi:hypothetical protein
MSEAARDESRDRVDHLLDGRLAALQPEAIGCGRHCCVASLPSASGSLRTVSACSVGMGSRAGR